MTREAAIPVERHHLLNGWLFSLALHSLLLCVALSWLHQSSTRMLPNPFQWEVSLVQSPQVLNGLAVPEQAADQPIGATKNPQPAPTAPVDRTAVPHARTASVHQTPNKPIPAEPQPETLSSVAQTVPQTESSVTDAAPSVPQTADPTMQQPNPLPHATIQEPSTPATVETPSQPESGPTSDPGQPTQTQVIASAKSNAASSTRADYSWLQRMIFQRLEELKRSSRPQLDGLQPLKVLVKAVVSDEGMLLESEVVKSSGLDRIDQEAMALVRRAFPMQFERSIDRRQIVMRIPISYSRD